MKKEYIIVRIDASPDGAPYVIVSLSTSKDFREQSTPPSPFGAGGVMGFTNMDDMVKNLNKMLSGGGVWVKPVLPPQSSLICTNTKN